MFAFPLHNLLMQRQICDLSHCFIRQIRIFAFAWVAVCLLEAVFGVDGLGDFGYGTILQVEK